MRARFSQALTTTGIVLRTYPFGEADLIARILTPEHGKLSAIAKSARRSKRRLASSIDIFDRGKFELQRGRGALWALVGMLPTRSLGALRDTLERVTVGTVLCEVFDHLSLDEGPVDARLFDALELGLEAVASTSSLKEMLRALFVATSAALAIAGFSSHSESGEPSAQNLRRLIKRLEEATDKEVKTMGSLEFMISELRDGADMGLK